MMQKGHHEFIKKKLVLHKNIIKISTTAQLFSKNMI
jgi:hypothetical protein